MIPSISHISPEVMQTAMTALSDTTPEEWQTMMTTFSSMTRKQWQTVITGLFNMTPKELQARMTNFSNTNSKPQLENSTNEVQEPQYASGTTSTVNSVSEEQATNETAQTTNVLENPASYSEQLEPQANNTRQPHFDWSTILHNISSFFNTQNSADQVETGKPKEDSQDEQSHSHERKHNDYVDDLDLD